MPFAVAAFVAADVVFVGLNEMSLGGFAAKMSVLHNYYWKVGNESQFHSNQNAIEGLLNSTARANQGWESYNSFHLTQRRRHSALIHFGRLENVVG